MPESRKCPECGAELPPEGVCVVCALRGAKEMLDADPSTASTASTATTIAAVTPSDLTGEKIGPYKLLQQIGEGGMGSVWMAEQQQPFRRVALKLVKLGMDTKQVVARFRAEQQALALMDHPNIAKVFEAGATENGRPYFVMELVHGIPITAYCDKERLSTNERLDLFMQVCQAIQHAHQKGVIHRDIKPSNILVTMLDGAPVPKVIDFGIAKATQGKLVDETLFTAFEQFIGTPAYMSPEQAEMNALDIDTRSDIYSLGVLLYELLSGKTPFDTKKLVEAGLDEIRRVIREVEPSRPSTRFSTLDAKEQTTVARQRHSEPPKLIHLVRGDLDWIVMKCLEKDRRRRYETANGLAMDIQRYRGGEAVVAAPPSAAYRFEKFVRRNRVAVTAGGAVMAALVLGLSLSTWLFFRERAAQQAQAGLRRQAEAEAVKSRRIAQFLKDMLRGVGPSKAKGRDTTMLGEILDETARQVSGTLTNEPEVEGELLDTVGRVYTQLGDYKEAELRHRRALEVRRALWGNENTNVASSLHELANAQRYLGKLKEAEATQREALELERKLLGPEHADVASSLNNLALILRAESKLKEAEAGFREVLAMQRRLFGEEHAMIATALNNLGGVLGNQGRFGEAETTFRAALQMRRKLFGPEHADVASSLNDLGTVLSQQDRYDEAAELLTEALAMRKKLLPPGHAEVAATLINLGTVRSRQGKPAEAEQAFREGLAIQQKTFTTNGWQLAAGFVNLGSLLHGQRKLGEAAEAYREGARLLGSQFPNGHPTLALVLANRASVLADQRRLAEAEQAARESLAVQIKLSSKEHLYTANSLAILSTILSQEGKLAEAQAACEEALQIRRKLLPANHGDIADLLNNLAIQRQEQGDLDAAESAARESVAMKKRLDGDEGEEVAVCMGTLAGVLSDTGKHDEAEQLCRQGLAILKKKPDADRQNLASLLVTLSRILINRGKTADAEAVLREVLAQQRQDPPASDVEIARSQHNLAAVLLEQGKLAEAETAEREALATLQSGLGETHPDVGDALGGLAEALLARGDADQAAPLALQSLKLAEQSRPDAWSTFATRGTLGTILLRQKNYAEAEPLLLSAFEGLSLRERNLPPNGKAKRRQAARGLAELYTAQGKPEKAAEWSAKLAAVAPAQ